MSTSACPALSRNLLHKKMIDGSSRYLHCRRATARNKIIMRTSKSTTCQLTIRMARRYLLSGEYCDLRWHLVDESRGPMAQKERNPCANGNANNSQIVVHPGRSRDTNGETKRSSLFYANIYFKSPNLFGAVYPNTKELEVLQQF